MTAQKTNLGGMAIDSPLRRWRKSQGYTQEHLARLVGVHLDSINRWEQGKRAPHRTILERLMAITGLSSEAILFPVRWLREHPEYLKAYAEQPPRRGRRPRQRPPESPPAEHG
jgi:transcriptional regulator with XRE-family HTH domain